MPNAFGDSFTEKQLGSDLQVFRMLDESETDNGLLSCPQLILKKKRDSLDLSVLLMHTREVHVDAKIMKQVNRLTPSDHVAQVLPITICAGGDRRTQALGNGKLIPLQSLAVVCDTACFVRRKYQPNGKDKGVERALRKKDRYSRYQ